MPPEAVPRDNWRIRRKVIFGALIYFGVHISAVLWQGKDTSLNQQAVIAMIGAVVAIIGSYVFGAAWDDASKRRAFGRRDAPDRGEFEMPEKDKE